MDKEYCKIQREKIEKPLRKPRKKTAKELLIMKKDKCRKGNKVCKCK